MKAAPKSPNPLNVKQARFAELVASGENSTQAYLKAGYEVSNAIAGSAGARLLKNVRVAARVAELRSVQTRTNLLTKDEKRAFLAEILRTPIGEIGPDSVLCQEYTREQVAGGNRGKLKRGKADSGNEIDGVPVIRTRVRMADKLKALELDSKLAGHFEPDQVVVETGPKTLESLEARAKEVASALQRNFRKE